MRILGILIIALLIAIAAACQGPPPTMVVLVVTATPETEVTTTLSMTPTRQVSPTLQTPSPVPPTETPTATPTPDIQPTAVLGQIQVAEQVFENGRMFWVQPTQQIWVMFNEDGDATRGDWVQFEDTFQEGEPESDPTITVPEGRYQPTRGFGKLWRSSPEIRERLGFGLTSEFGYVSSYEYHAGGSIGPDGQWQSGPGYHILFSLYNEQFRFNEADGTWVKL